MWVNVMKNKKEKIVTICFIVAFLILIIPVIVKFCIDLKSVTSDRKEEISRIDFYGYSLSKSDTKITKDVYKELDSVLSADVVDYDMYATLISKLFLIDLFNLDNKLSSTDIGGTMYLHSGIIDNFRENMGATLYNHVKSNIDGKRTQKLPIVKDVIVNNVTPIKYKYNDVEYDGYTTSCNIVYEEDLGYQSSVDLTLIKDDKILYIVKGE